MPGSACRKAPASLLTLEKGRPIQDGPSQRYANFPAPLPLSAGNVKRPYESRRDLPFHTLFERQQRLGQHWRDDHCCQKLKNKIEADQPNQHEMSQICLLYTSVWQW